jgi:anti-sigma regulatory factor (Ser/Thr protein kinase)
MSAVAPAGDFRHEALFYAGEDAFIGATMPFISDAVAAGEPILVVVSAGKIERLREALGPDAGAVQFADMDEVGANPARIIPAWRAFVDRHAGDGRRFRGIGQPIWAERSPAELVECERHEALLNVAFADAPAWWLLCPYDTETLDAAVLEEARRNHPFVADRSGRQASAAYRGLEAARGAFGAPLPEPACQPAELPFQFASLAGVRDAVSERAAAAGLDPGRIRNLVLAVNEVATNSVRHGAGRGTVRTWEEPGELVCEVRDAGHLDRPLAGREAPAAGGGAGLWLANQMCDLVQLRTFASGTVVRLHVRRG